MPSYSAAVAAAHKRMPGRWGRFLRRPGFRAEVHLQAGSDETQDTALVSALGDAERARSHLAAIVDSSEDAIVSKTLDGIVTSWNAAAERLFGFSASEMIGESITKIIPEDLQHEEIEILAKLRRGERIERYETTRVRKDGERLDISL